MGTADVGSLEGIGQEAELVKGVPAGHLAIGVVLGEPAPLLAHDEHHLCLYEGFRFDTNHAYRLHGFSRLRSVLKHRQ